MKYRVVTTKRFKTAYERVSQLKGFKKSVFEEVVLTLAEGRKFEPKFKDHRLTGNLKDFRGCHLTPDILMIYQVDEGVLMLTLVSVGHHSQLFK